MIIDCSDSANVNVYGSSAFRTRHSRFLNELADSLRRMKRDLSDSGGEKRAARAILSFRIDKTGKVNDVVVNCADSSDAALKDALQARALSWRFVYYPSLPLKVIQDIRITGRNPQGFFGRHRIAVIIGLIALGVLLFY
jgi:ribosomal protein L44E